MCEFIAAIIIVGAVETGPNTMQVEHLFNESVEILYVDTAEYIQCTEGAS